MLPWHAPARRVRGSYETVFEFLHIVITLQMKEILLKVSESLIRTPRHFVLVNKKFYEFCVSSCLNLATFLIHYCL